MISALPFYEFLTPDERETLERASRVKTLERGGVIHNGTDVCLGLVYILRGSLRAYILSESGREITIFRVGAGELCVLTAACVISEITFDTEMVAESECELLIIGGGTVSALMRGNLRVRSFLYELATRRFSAVMTVMQQLLFTPLESRIAAFLLSQSGEIRITHEQLAAQINSSREVVSRALARLSADGVLSLSRGRIKIKDREKLKSII